MQYCMWRPATRRDNFRQCTSSFQRSCVQILRCPAAKQNADNGCTEQNMIFSVSCLFFHQGSYRRGSVVRSWFRHIMDGAQDAQWSTQGLEATASALAGCQGDGAPKVAEQQHSEEVGIVDNDRVVIAGNECPPCLRAICHARSGWLAGSKQAWNGWNGGKFLNHY